MNPYLRWIDWLWDLEAHHLDHWLTVLIAFLQIGLWFGVGLYFGLKGLSVRIRNTQLASERIIQREGDKP